MNTLKVTVYKTAARITFSTSEESNGEPLIHLTNSKVSIFHLGWRQNCKMRKLKENRILECADLW